MEVDRGGDVVPAKSRKFCKTGLSLGNCLKSHGFIFKGQEESTHALPPLHTNILKYNFESYNVIHGKGKSDISSRVLNFSHILRLWTWKFPLNNL